MRYTIHQLAQLSQITKQGILARMNKASKHLKVNFKAKYGKKINGKWTINEAGKRLVVDKYNEKKHKEFTGNLSINDTIKYLENQNVSLNKKLDCEQEELNHEQQLHLQDNKQADYRIKQLQRQNNAFQKQLSYHKQKPQEHGFWWKLLH